jgi:predicted nucleotidyltransferase component of viral defense system
LIDKREIINFAAQVLLTPHVVEKDYVLGWMLAGIYAHEELAESWIFKGGTCLKKCFFETYRFSEDLDFTLRNEAHLDEAFLKRVFAEVGTWIYDETGIEILPEPPRQPLLSGQDKLQGAGFADATLAAR